jgi:hypothetical protein
MKVVTFSVKGQVVRLGTGPGPVEDRVERDAVPAPLGVKPRDVADLIGLGEPVEVLEPKIQGVLHGPVDFE